MTQKKKEAPHRQLSLTLVNSDCVDFLRKLQSKSVDLVLTDPPYEISRDTGFSSVKTGVKRFAVSMDFGAWDRSAAPLDETLKECYRALRDGGTVVVFYDLWKISYLAELLRKNGFKQLRLIEWVKTNPVPLNSSRNYLTNAREVALVAVKGSRPVFNSKYDNGIYSYPICHDKGRFHPTQKPVALLSELVEKHSREGDLVVDCFAGSASTAVAAIRSGRNFLGCELSKSYFTKAIERLHEEVAKEILLRSELP